MELASTYALHNFYCYAIDAKSPPLFREQMKALTSCFPNVMLTTTELNMDSSGTNIDRSLWECAKTLSEFKWQYVIFLQVKNDDDLNNSLLELRYCNKN
jgi:hypothetical protein